MRKALLILAAMAAVGWMASATPGGDPEGPRRGPASARDGSRPRPPGLPPHSPAGHESPHRGPAGRGSRRPFGRRHTPPIFQELTDEQVEEILAFVREKMPWRYERLRALQESRPDLFRRMCRRLRFEIGQLRQLKKEAPGAYEAAIEEHRLRARVADLAARARGADSAEERKRLAAEIRDVFERLFDAERKAREAQIRQLEQRIRQLREQLAERAEHRDRIIEHLLHRVLAGRQESDKDEPPPPAEP